MRKWLGYRKLQQRIKATNNKDRAYMANYIDVCNGDADGLCSVVQWRLYEPRAARLITGLKREIELLEQVQAAPGDELLVCDLSMQRNRQPLLRLLEAGAVVRYFDHHKVDAIPVHPRLEATIDVASDVCTSLLVDRYLNGRFRAWAVVGAYGDNLTGVAERLAMTLGLSFDDRRHLQALGESINYNAYGDGQNDVTLASARLYELLAGYADPLQFLRHEAIGKTLDTLRLNDLERARDVPPYWQDARVSVYLLPDVPWSRRVSGSLGNFLANAQVLRAHAVLTARAAGDFKVSVRAPLRAPDGAAEFCRLFGGDGRAGAAGIEHLPAGQLDQFIKAFSAAPWDAAPPARGD
jgi:hypothetical protein